MALKICAVLFRSVSTTDVGDCELTVLIYIYNLQGGQAGVGAAGAGAGGLPTDTSILTLALSLILVPLGLSAVAVFPPFAT